VPNIILMLTNGMSSEGLCFSYPIRGTNNHVSTCKPACACSFLPEFVALLILFFSLYLCIFFKSCLLKVEIENMTLVMKSMKRKKRNNGN
jgi:hypothetical protein